MQTLKAERAKNEPNKSGKEIVKNLNVTGAYIIFFKK
jgi:hypothetical protein